MSEQNFSALELNKALKHAIKFANAPLTATEAAEYLRVSRAKFYDEMVPHLPWFEIGGRRLYAREDLDAYIQKQRYEPVPQYSVKVDLNREKSPQIDPSEFQIKVPIKARKAV